MQSSTSERILQFVYRERGENEINVKLMGQTVVLLLSLLVVVPISARDDCWPGETWHWGGETHGRGAAEDARHIDAAADIKRWHLIWRNAFYASFLQSALIMTPQGAAHHRLHFRNTPMILQQPLKLQQLRIFFFMSPDIQTLLTQFWTQLTEDQLIKR